MSSADTGRVDRSASAATLIARRMAIVSLTEIVEAGRNRVVPRGEQTSCYGKVEWMAAAEERLVFAWTGSIAGQNIRVDGGIMRST